MSPVRPLCSFSYPFCVFEKVVLLSVSDYFHVAQWTEALTVEGYNIILYIKSDLHSFIIIIGGQSIAPNYINHHP